MFGCDSDEDFYKYVYEDEETGKNVKADGKKTVYWEFYVKSVDDADKLSKKVFGDTDWTGYGYEDDNGDFIFEDYSFCHPIKQSEITLIVIKGSDGEKWAKSHNIKYKFMRPETRNSKTESKKM